MQASKKSATRAVIEEQIRDITNINTIKKSKSNQKNNETTNKNYIKVNGSSAVKLTGIHYAGCHVSGNHLPVTLVYAVCLFPLLTKLLRYFDLKHYFHEIYILK